jgi:5-methylcytosine-specific restriction endonuclease McrA
MDVIVFYKWYEDQSQSQNDCCIYCGLPVDTTKYYGRYFRYGRRGKRLEVDRKESKAPYSPDNCVLACYPCNNAKSDVFSYEEYLKIGDTINQIKNQKC